ncbi:alpha/beta fold hydrolase [Sporosarcina sp. FA15]|uniref:alpha/beta fold hydrolase n=1 Tax=Sporosarcina sp. FA15 TaxID=3413031 RepID=UPI003F656A73
MSDSKKNSVIVFIHGLNGDPIDTWKRDRFTKTLPELIGSDQDIDDLDVYSFGYKTGFTPGQYDFRQIAKLLHSDIMAKIPGRDIVFVGHSMGGLVIQQYIIDRYKMNDEINLKLIKGAIFLCVPFKGAPLASIFGSFNKQIRSLQKRSNQLKELEEEWTTYTLRGGSKIVPKNLVHSIPQLLMYGAQDGVVTEQSSSPLHLDDAIKYPVDVDHKGICKTDESSAIFKHIKTFLLNSVKETKMSMMLSIQGYDKQKGDGEGVSLDWTAYIKYKPRLIPTCEIWENQLNPELAYSLNTWEENWSKKTNRIRVQGKLPLTAGIAIGTHFSKTKGTILEIDHYGELWSTDKIDMTYKPYTEYHSGNSQQSKTAILILSVSKDIHSEVKEFLGLENKNYRMLVNVLPESGPSQTSIETAEQAVAYASKVKEVAEDLKSKGINEIYLFLNTPFSLALFVGHYLTAMPLIQTFDYTLPGYVESCRI